MLGPYKLANVNCVWLMDALIIINLPSGSTMDELLMSGMFLLTRIETPRCLLLSVDEKI